MAHRSGGVLFAIGFCLTALAALFLAWAMGVWSLTLPALSKSPVEGLSPLPQTSRIVVDFGGRPITFKED